VSRSNRLSSSGLSYISTVVATHNHLPVSLRVRTRCWKSRASETRHASILARDSEAIKFLGSARYARLFNNHHLVCVIDYFLVIANGYIDAFAASTRTTLSTEASPRLTWLIQLVTAQPVPPAMVPPLGTS
jgi:hypothetical protein